VVAAPLATKPAGKTPALRDFAVAVVQAKACTHFLGIGGETGNEIGFWDEKRVFIGKVEQIVPVNVETSGPTDY
jgi:hypothetical protein